MVESLNPLKAAIYRILCGSNKGVIKGDTRSLD